jgi:hypothetical protein
MRIAATTRFADTALFMREGAPGTNLAVNPEGPFVVKSVVRIG